MRVYHLGILKDGGDFYITADQLNKWKQIYSNVDISEVIEELKEQFSKLNKQGALKLINKTLRERN